MEALWPAASTWGLVWGLGCMCLPSLMLTMWAHHSIQASLLRGSCTHNSWSLLRSKALSPYLDISRSKVTCLMHHPRPRSEGKGLNIAVQSVSSTRPPLLGKASSGRRGKKLQHIITAWASYFPLPVEHTYLHVRETMIESIMLSSTASIM